MKRKKLILYLTYFFVTFSQGIGHQVLKYSPTSWSNSILEGLLFAIPATFFTIFYYSFLWHFIGVKLFRGTISFKTTMYSMGYAWFWPNLLFLLATFTSLFGFLTYGKIIFSNYFYLSVLAIYAISKLWGLINSGIALKNLNQYGRIKTVILLICFAILFFILRGLSSEISSLFY